MLENQLTQTPENDDDFLWPDVNNTAIAYTYEKWLSQGK